MKKKIIVSLIFNSLIFVLVFFCSFCALFDYKFITNPSIISFKPYFSIFQYFTTDSNIFSGIVSAVMIGFEISCLAKRKYELPKSILFFKLIATTTVTLTMLTTIFYLAPRDPAGYFNKFQDSNLFFHFIVPVFALISFLCFEKTNKLSKKTPLFAIIPVILYATYYAINGFSNVQNGIVPPAYDFYGFFDAGFIFAIILIPLMLFATYLISVVLWFVNKKEL